MKQEAISIRPFIGAKNFDESRNFYQDIGFTEVVLSPVLSLFTWGELGFYLQNYYQQDWVDNTMIFFQVKNTALVYEELAALNLPKKYSSARLVPIRDEHWGRECFLHDPSGVLLHFGEFF
ncbi:VOC family protein [Flavobacterium subsaxonicum]|uniref:Glyoxalase n=1 Tax=Flavobacterium subsaxonicum WB 4.1-42 = DSM 21790 TaxID=1121898 RepID=A0A0A2MH64_9FLAO|nr:glyoxalase [Flavobacterium subsaxonicum]KGO90961.1 glyoxalase [Flavobacterium subsaxonicum WB 4.1-42 = DSM 21790]